MLIFEYRYNRKKKLGSSITGKGLVESPAIEKPAVLHFSTEKPPVNISLKSDNNDNFKFMLKDEGDIFTGPLMIPDIKIYRSAKSLGLEEDGFIFFKADTIKKMFEDWMQSDNINKNTFDHETEIDGCPLVEAWLVIDSEKDKSNALGIKQTVGTAMISLKINNKDVKEKIKNGEITGFSIEAEGLERIQMSEDKEIISDELADLFVEHLKKVGQTLEELEAEGYKLIPEEEANKLELAIESDPNAQSSLDRERYIVRFYYKGPRDDKNRPFCAHVLDLGLWYRKEDIDQMSFRSENKEFGTYSIFKYEGSYGCRHTWDKNYFSKSYKFNKEELVVQPGPTETNEEFMSRCIGTEIDNGYDQSQAAAICYSKWDSKLKSDAEDEEISTFIINKLKNKLTKS
jgi:hypothetical protein